MHEKMGYKITLTILMIVLLLLTSCNQQPQEELSKISSEEKQIFNLINEINTIGALEDELAKSLALDELENLSFS